MTFVCTTCGQEFADIPEGAVQLTPGGLGRGRGRVNSFRFVDGSVHHLRRVMSLEHKHKIFHKKTPRPDCIYCNTPPEPVVEQEVVEVLQLQEPIKQVIAEPHVEDDESSLTSMALAFRRINRR